MIPTVAVSSELSDVHVEHVMYASALCIVSYPAVLEKSTSGKTCALFWVLVT